MLRRTAEEDGQVDQTEAKKKQLRPSLSRVLHSRTLETFDQSPRSAPSPIHRSATSDGFSSLSLLPAFDEFKVSNDPELGVPHSATTVAELKSKSKRKSRRPLINTRAIQLQLISEQKRVDRQLAIRVKKQTQMIAAKRNLDDIYPSHLTDQESLVFELCIARNLLDNLNQQENTLINELELLMNQLLAEYLSELAKGENKNREHIAYLEEIVHKGTIMVNKIKEFGARPEDMLTKIREFSEAAQANRRQFCVKVGQIVELLIFVAVGAVLGGCLGYAIGHLFFIYFTSTAVSAGFSTGASLGLALGKSAIGVGAVAAANLSVWSRFSIFYKETPLEKLSEKVAVAATNVVNKKSK